MQNRSAAPRVRVAFVGTGGIARLHARALSTLTDGAEIVAVCDALEERAREFADEFGGSLYSDFTSMLEGERPDAVLVCTPNYLHAPLTLEALEAGVNVFCEKPIATTLSDATLMKATAERAGKVLYIGFNHRFIGKYALAKTLIESGEYGSVL